MKFSLKFGQCRSAIAVFLLSAPMLVACAKSAVPVPIHGVNHRAEPFSYVLVDPTNPENTGGGELVESFSAGGTVCCYTLPAKWKPGIKIEIRETHYLPMLKDRTIPEVKQKFVVDLPPYIAGAVGELWVIRAPDGSVGLISSNYQPDHAKWPGKIKGWPVPSLEYQRARQDLYIKDAQDAIETSRSGLKELAENPAKHAQERWALTAEHRRQDLKGFSGPDDVAYLQMLKDEYETGLVQARARLQREKDARP
jgi:hypothetical protein